MNTKINLQTILIIFMVCVTVIFSTNAYVKAQAGGTEGSAEFAPEGEIMVDPVPGGPGFIMVSAFDFKSLSSVYPIGYDGTALINPDTSHDISAVTGITLPHGATISKLTLFFYDASSLDVSVSFYRVNTAGERSIMKAISTAGAQALWKSISNTTPIKDSSVDNQNYSYYLLLYLPANASANLKIANVRIDYEYPGYLPCVQK